MREIGPNALLCVQGDGFLFTCSPDGLSSQSTLGFSPELICANSEFGCVLAFGEQKLVLLHLRNGKLSQTGPLSLSAEIVGMSFGHYRDQHSEQFEPLILLLINVDSSLQLVAMPASRFSFQAATDLDIGLELPLQAENISYCALDGQYMHCQFSHNGRPFLSSSIVLFQDDSVVANRNLVFPSVFPSSAYFVKYKGAPETGAVSGGRILADGELIPK